MLIEVKARVAWKINGKTKKKMETYILFKEIFAQAEYDVMATITDYINDGTAEDFEIIGLKQSNIKEIISQYEGEYSYVVTLRDTITQDDGTEKQMKYKVLLWANNISEAMNHAREVASQGYDMQIDGLKEVNYTFLNSNGNGESETSEDQQSAGA